MNEAVRAMFEKLKADPRTSWIGAGLLMLWGLGQGIGFAGYEPWGSGVSGFAVFVACVVLAFTMLSPPKDPPTGAA